jgi:nucleoside-diphosphate-sugar epimerase
MRIAILGATSQIAKDLILSISGDEKRVLDLYARRPDCVCSWLDAQNLRGPYVVSPIAALGAADAYDVIINFVGVGDPATAKKMGASILEITHRYDQLVLDHLQLNPACRYIFLSSGAAFGNQFEHPVDVNAASKWDINHLSDQDWYGISKFYAECRHRAEAEFSIVDVRVFNYFSHTQDMKARFFINDMVRAIQEGQVFVTSAENISRDFIGPKEFSQIIEAILKSAPVNAAVDCYTLEPLGKFALLEAAKAGYGLRYEIAPPAQAVGVNATGSKRNYYSTNKIAEQLGYLPAKTSLQVVMRELEKLLGPSGDIVDKSSRDTAKR